MKTFFFRVALSWGCEILAYILAWQSSWKLCCALVLWRCAQGITEFTKEDTKKLVADTIKLLNDLKP